MLLKMNNDGVYIHRRQHKTVMIYKCNGYGVETAACPRLFDRRAQRAQTSRWMNNANRGEL